jgi:hypothetical protein
LFLVVGGVPDLGAITQKWVRITKVECGAILELQAVFVVMKKFVIFYFRNLLLQLKWA